MTGQEKKTLIRGFRHKLNELHRRGDISDNQFDIFNNLLQVHLFSYVNEPRIEKEYFELMIGVFETLLNSILLGYDIEEKLMIDESAGTIWFGIKP